MSSGARRSPRRWPSSSSRLSSSLLAVSRGEAALVAASESAFVHADLGGRVADSGALAELTARGGGVPRGQGADRRCARPRPRRAQLGVATGSGDRRARSSPVVAARGVRRGGPVAPRALTVLLANAQGAVAPLASVASLLPAEGGPGELRGVLADLRLARRPTRRRGSEDRGRAPRRLHPVPRRAGRPGSRRGVVFMTVALRAVSRRWRQRRTGRSSPADVGRDGHSVRRRRGFFLLLSLANTSTWIDPVSRARGDPRRQLEPPARLRQTTPVTAAAMPAPSSDRGGPSDPRSTTTGALRRSARDDT